MIYQFNRFIGDRFRSHSQYVALSTNNKGLTNLRLSAALCRRIDIHKNPYVVLYWDKEATSIGIKFIDKKEKKEKAVFKITRDTGNSGKISLTGFLHTFNIDYQKYLGKHEVSIENISDIGELIIVNLKK